MKSSSSPDSPGVLIPPPSFYAIAYVAGALLEMHYPLRFPGTETVRRVAASGVLLAGALFGGAAVLQFLRLRTNIFPHKPASALATAGLYRISRNPMYLGLTALYLGIALLLDHVWPIITLPIAIIVIDSYVIRREEAYLSRRFGSEYDDYRRRVRRWL